MANSPIWRPFSQMKTAPAPLEVLRGQGAWLELADGRKILDCISSWWVTIHGHGHPLLAKALYQQAQQLEQVIFAGFTHAPAETLAARLIQTLGGGRLFFSDNGSTAVEVALKIAYQYWQNLGQTQRHSFICFEGGYHGDTFGAMAIAKTSSWWQRYHQLLFDTDPVAYPALGDQVDPEQLEASCLNQVEALLAQQRHAAIIIEPLVQGAGGMRFCRPVFLQRLAELARSYQTLLIYDEVMTGFGRTGELFACQKSHTSPDLLCLSKGLSGGCLPLAVTIATEQIYQAFWHDDPNQAFYHGHSYTGNPLACATGVASLEMLTANPHCYQQLEAWHWQFYHQYLTDHPDLSNFRVCGTIAAMEVTARSSTPGYFHHLAAPLKAEFLAAGFLLRPLGNTIYIMPPYCIGQEELGSIYAAIAQVVSKVVAEAS
ncbi:MAG: adenosylmethionine--8-amino-7-oxononanoate transaminase [Pseudanabaenaceae cyanobacterium bins.68]|nr:adenosylmethionine--8-amino-7-oxononanoate transaminase [Pseudanabaenaceae cyanobacterium bins.68]